MSLQWQWIWDFEDKAHREGDGERLRLAALYEQVSLDNRTSANDRMTIYGEGKALAQRLGEPWWEMFYEHHLIDTLLVGNHQPLLALDHAVRAVVQVSKPLYRDFPQRLGLQLDLVHCYIAIDPLGYESEIRMLFAYLEKQCAETSELRFTCWRYWTLFLFRIEDEKFFDAALLFLHRALEEDHEPQALQALRLLCYSPISFDDANERLDLLDLSTRGEQLARHLHRNEAIPQFLMCRAMAARHCNQEEEAQRLYRESIRMRARLKPPRIGAPYGAAAFHKMRGESEVAVRICQSQIQISPAQGHFGLARVRLEKCRLLQQLGRDISREAKRLRRVAAKLKSQAHWEKKLRELEEAPKENH